MSPLWKKLTNPATNPYIYIYKTEMKVIKFYRMQLSENCLKWFIQGSADFYKME